MTERIGDPPAGPAGPHHPDRLRGPDAAGQAEPVQAQPPDGAVPRFAQLTYASFDPGDGTGGGWQVKDTVGELGTDERAFLAARVSTQLGVGEALPLLPTAPELAARPRRMLYASVPGGGVAYWHTVAAGTDSTGRPGNVFAHVLLDRRPADVEPALRPADLVASPQWLQPHGPDGVLATSLAGVPDPPWPGSYRRDELVAFLVQRAASHPGVLAALLDAIDAAMNGGPMVLLGVTDPRHAALWIAGVSQFMSPGESRGFYWSTRERARGVATAHAYGLHLVALPLAELADVPPLESAEGAAPRGVLVIADVEDGAQLGDLPTGGPHRTEAGATIAVTPWSVLVPAVLLDETLAHDVLDTQDRIAVQVGDRDLARGWPLALAVAHLADDRLAEALPEARQILAGPAPAGLRTALRWHDLWRATLTSTLGRTTQDALDGVPDDRGVARDLAVNEYLARAIDDPEWLVQQGGVPVPEIAAEDLDPMLVELAEPRLVELATAASAASNQELQAVRLLDLLVRCGLFDGGPPPARVTGPVGVLLNRVVGPILLAPQYGPALVDDVGPVDERTQAMFLRPYVDGVLQSGAVPGPPGQRVVPAVLSWLFPVPPSPPAPDVPLPPSGYLPATLLELAAQAHLVVGDPRVFRPLALRAAAATPGGRSGADIERLAAGPPWSPGELCAVLPGLDPRRLTALLVPCLLTSSDGPELDTLVAALRTDAALSDERAGPRATVLARATQLRHDATSWWLGPGPEARTQRARSLLDGAEELLASDTASQLAEDLVMSIVAAWVADLVVRPAVDQARPAVERLVQHRPAAAVPPAVVDALLAALSRGVVDDHDVAVAAVLSSPAWGDAPRLAPRRRPEVAALLAGTDDGGVEPLLDHLMRLRVGGGTGGPTVGDPVRRTLDDYAHAHGRPMTRRQHDVVDRWFTSVGVVAAEEPSAPSRSRWGLRRRETGEPG